MLFNYRVQKQKKNEMIFKRLISPIFFNKKRHDESKFSLLTIIQALKKK